VSAVTLILCNVIQLLNYYYYYYYYYYCN